VSECKTCGRDDGHWIGCAEARGPWADMAGDINVLPSGSRLCASGDCPKPVESDDKRVKFCNEHRDPKNRK
jgi:hypothetical protein